MTPAPNTYELPGSKKRAELRPAPPAAPEPMQYAPALLLAVCCVFLLLFALAFDPYPELMLMEPGVWKWLAEHSPLFFIPAVFCWLMSVVFALLAVIMRWSRFRNAVVLMLCFFAPLIALMLGAWMRVLLLG